MTFAEIEEIKKLGRVKESEWEEFELMALSVWCRSPECEGVLFSDWLDHPGQEEKLITLWEQRRITTDNMKNHKVTIAGLNKIELFAEYEVEFPLPATSEDTMRLKKKINEIAAAVNMLIEIEEHKL
jgi:hypothetical protein